MPVNPVADELPAVLLIVADPLGSELPPLDLWSEVQAVYRRVRASHAPLHFRRLAPPTRRALQSELLQRHFSVVHFMGHGSEDGLWLERASGEAEFVRSSELAELFLQARVDLVILNLCASHGPGQALMAAGVRAVLVSERAIPDRAAGPLAEAAYAVLAAGRSMREVLQAARTAVRSSGYPEVAEDIELLLGSGGDFSLPTPQEQTAGPVIEWGEPRHNLTVDVFLGRVEELHRLYDWLAVSNARAVSVVGIGGIGKTAFVQAAAWRYAPRWPDGIVLLSARDRPNYQLADALDAIYRVLDWPLPDSPAGLDQREVLERLASSACLLIWDNLETVTPKMRQDIARFLYEWDPRAGGQAILVAREHLSEFADLVRGYHMVLDSLDAASAKQLLKVNVAPQPDAFQALAGEWDLAAELAHNHPLLLELTAGQLVRGATWLEVRRQLEGLRGRQTEAVIEGLLGHTTDRLIAAHPRIQAHLEAWPAFVGGATAESWAWLALGARPDEDSEEWDDCVEAQRILRDAVLFSRDRAGRYSAHSLVGLYLQRRFWDRLPAERREALQREHIACFREWVKAGKGDLEAELLNLQRAFGWARMLGDDVAVCSLTLGVQPFFWKHTHLHEWRDWLTVALEAAQRLQDWSALGNLQNSLGTLYGRWGDMEQARNWFELGRRTFANQGNREGEAKAMSNLALVAINLKEFDHAERLLQDALDLAGPSARPELLRPFHTTLARLNLDQGRINQAEVHYRQALEQAERMESAYDIALIRVALSEALADAGDLDQAESEASQALDMATLHDFTEVKAWARYYLAYVALKRRQWSQAATLCLDSLREALPFDLLKVIEHGITLFATAHSQLMAESQRDGALDLQNQLRAVVTNSHTGNRVRVLQLWENALQATLSQADGSPPP